MEQREALPRVELMVKDIEWNPFRKDIQNGKLNMDKVQELRKSIKDLDFWDNVTVRKRKHLDKVIYQLVYGHRRVAAAGIEFGPNALTSCALVNYDDADMLRGMARENATGEQDSIAAQVDLIKVTRKFILEHPEVCPQCKSLMLPGNIKVGHRKHEPAGENCTADFLEDDKNWSRIKVHELFVLGAGDADAVKISPEILPHMKNYDPNDREPGSIGLKVGLALSKLAPQAQEIAAEIIQEGDVFLPKAIVEDCVRTVKQLQLPPAKEAKAIKEELKEALVDVAETQKNRKYVKTRRKEQERLDKSWKDRKKTKATKPKPDIEYFLSFDFRSIHSKFEKQCDELWAVRKDLSLTQVVRIRRKVDLGLLFYQKNSDRWHKFESLLRKGELREKPQLRLTK